MTVAELIEKLKKLPQHLPVYVEDWSEQRCSDAVAGDPQIKPFNRDSLPTRVVIGDK